MENNKKIKVLLAAGIFPPDIGGPATFADALFKVLPEYGCEVRVLTYGKFEVRSSKFEVEAVIRKQNIFLRYLKYFYKVWKLSRWADIIYAFDIISVGLPCAIVKLFRPKMKLIVRLGGDHLYETALERGWFEGTMKDYYREKRFGIRGRFIYMLNQFVLKRCDRVIFNAEFLRGLYISERGVKEEKTLLIKNIRPVFNFDGIDILEKGEAVKILYIGRLTAVRNLLGLLKAYTAIRPDLKAKTSLEIVGEGPEGKKLKAYIEKNGLGSRVQLYPKLPHSQALRKMGESDLLVIPSYTECNAHTIAEAGSLNKLMIVTQESELYYSGVKQKGIIYIDPMDTQDITIKLERAIEHALAHDLGVEEGMKAIEGTTWEIGVVMDKHLELFKEITER